MLRADSKKTGADLRHAVQLSNLARHMVVLHRPDLRVSVLLSDGRYAVQIDLEGVDDPTKPLQLHWQLSGLSRLQPQLQALHRLAALYRYGRLPKTLFPPITRLDRVIQSLRAYDAAAGQVSLAQIAEALFGAERVKQDWRGGSDYLRSRVRRLLRLSRDLIQGGYRHLLH